MRHGRLAPLGLACVLSPAALAQQAFLAGSVGVFFPTDNDLRDALGDSWFSFGATATRIDSVERRRTGVDWNAFNREKGGNKLFMLAVTYGVSFPLGDSDALARPYWAVRAGGSYIDYAVDMVGGRESAKRLGYNANAEIGVNVGDRLNISARYDLFPNYDSLNFSGFSLQLHYGLAKF